MNGNFASVARRLCISAVLLTLVGLVFAAGAFADAGNPILKTIQATSTDNGDGTVTISVRGQWNWQSHGSDCNFDRAATGAAIAWSDKNGRFQGTNEVQKLNVTGTVTGGTFRLKFNNVETGNLAYNISAANLQAALTGLSSIGAGNVSVTGLGTVASPWFITFQGALAETNVASISISNKSLTGSGTGMAIATSTSGVNGDPYNGYLLTNGTVTTFLGTKSATTPAAGRSNPQDKMVHPVDLGNKAVTPNLPGVTGAVSQTFNDPISNNPADYLSWKGGCGREPMSSTAILISSASKTGNTVTATTATANKLTEGDSGAQIFSMFNAGYNSPAANIDRNFVKVYSVSGNTFKYDVFNADGTPNTVGSGTSCTTTTLCKGNLKQQPWGSWGYQENANTHSYSHTYKKILTDGVDKGKSGLPDQICVNFYDVHGGGTTAAAIQKVNGASEITVDGNGDNSVETNDFNVNDGANCIKFNLSSITTDAKDTADVGDPINDTATLTSDAAGTITFTAYGPFAPGTTPDPATHCIAANVAFTSGAKETVTGSGTYHSDDYTNPAPGLYFWKAEFKSSTPLTGDATEQCNAKDETSKVNPATPTLVTDAGKTVTLDPVKGADLFDIATLDKSYNATGTISFNLYKGAGCTQANLVTGSPVGIKNGDPVAGNGTYTSASINVTTPGTYHWVAKYSGDVNNTAVENACVDAAETVKVIAPGIMVEKSVNKTVVHDDDTVTYTIKVTNTDPDSDLKDVAVADDTFPTECNKTIGILLAGKSFEYTCDAKITHGLETNGQVVNTATATGTTETGGTVKDTDDATVKVIHPSIDVEKTTDQPTPTVGDTVTFHIKVTNNGDTTLDTVVITDANAPGCARNPLKDSADGTTGNDVTLAPNASAGYDCTLADVQMTFTGNTAKACADDQLDKNVCDEDTVPVEPQKAKPTVTTNAGDDIVLGEGSLVDTATLGGGYKPTGSIKFNLYGPNDATCAKSIFESTVTVNGNADYKSTPPFTPTLAGTYRWIANYSGDLNNEATANKCNAPDEDVIVGPGKSSTVTAQSFVPQDSSTTTGFATPSGTAKFELFTTADCSGSPVYTETATLDGSSKAFTANSGVGPNGYTATGDGTWYWKVTYSGDANNQPSESKCGVEQFTIDNDTTK